MKHQHLDAETLERALRGEISAVPLLRQMLAHTLSLCGPCRRAWRRVALPERRQLVPEASPYAEIFARVLERTRQQSVSLEAERAAAPELVAELVQAPEAHQLELLRTAPQFQSWGVCDYLIRESAEAVFEDAEAAEGLAGLAIEVSRLLDPARYGAAFLADVQALAWAYLANARRVRSDLRGAAAAMATAEELLADGVGEPLVNAQLLSLKASLRRAQRRFEEAQQLLEEVVGIYHRLGDSHLEGKTLVKKAYGYHQAGLAAGAIPLLRRALGLLDPAQDPRATLCAHHNLIDCLLEAERPAEAAAHLETVRPLYAELAGFSTRTRLRWLEGKLAQASGESAAARVAYEEARQGFLEHGIGYDAALVSLDLALLFAGADRFDEVGRLAEEMYPIFQSREVHREALAALLLFQQAARQGALTIAVIEHVARFLRRARRQPSLRFEEPV